LSVWLRQVWPVHPRPLCNNLQQYKVVTAGESNALYDFTMSSTHFGFQSVEEQDKASRVRGVFDSVASRYDVMNDLMSVGMHRAWKAYTVMVANVKNGDRVLDIAGGTGDLALAFAPKVGATGQVVHTDINEAMLREGRNRLLDAGISVPTLACDAEHLPFADAYFDVITVAFGLRNMTHKDAALGEMRRVLKPGGKLLVLEFSKVAKPLEKIYDWYSFKVLPKLGKLVANDDASYQYLAESIRMHPDQDTLKAMMLKGGFGHVDYHNMSGGIVALHVAIRC
jgi:demethylmenaquinone methyltransferase / 2-methoxy-6-polyprenyl-1,4-benzoquinol methylase